MVFLKPLVCGGESLFRAAKVRFEGDTQKGSSLCRALPQREWMTGGFFGAGEVNQTTPRLLEALVDEIHFAFRSPTE